MKMVNNYIFDDGSIESKVLQFELIGQNPIIVKVPKYTKLDDWLAEIIEEDDNIKRVFLHFVFEDYALDGIDYRAEVARAHHLYPQLRIVMQYEQADRASIVRRASNYGISVKDKIEELPNVNKLIEENKDKAKIKEIDYGKYRVGGDVGIEVPIGKEVASDKITPEHENISDKFIDKLNEFKDKRRRKKDK